jgi:hypothetical protein
MSRAPRDSSDIDNALVAYLASDQALLALCPNGVYIDEAPPGALQFVIVSVVDAVDEAVFGGRAIEDILYLVEARMLSTTHGNIKGAGARIDALLDDQVLPLGSPSRAPGYTPIAMFRETRLPGRTEVDEVDPSLRWWRRGGQYRLQMAIDPFTAVGPAVSQTESGIPHKVTTDTRRGYADDQDRTVRHGEVERGGRLAGDAQNHRQPEFVEAEPQDHEGRRHLLPRP